MSFNITNLFVSRPLRVTERDVCFWLKHEPELWPPPCEACGEDIGVGGLLDHFWPFGGGDENRCAGCCVEKGRT